MMTPRAPGPTIEAIAIRRRLWKQEDERRGDGILAELRTKAVGVTCGLVFRGSGRRYPVFDRRWIQTYTILVLIFIGLHDTRA